MTEVKTVKVDNWGSFFLQKLQNFFNKTDYCDLTLQFRDNSQLKVHRLVLTTCTDFFNMLELSTDCQDDILHMPRDLQADVVVPIVNFMYTGTLEFEVRMYERLLKTARDMKMSVLLKLLEAHRRSMPVKSEPVILNRAVASRPAMRGGGYSARGRVLGRPANTTTTTVNRYGSNAHDEPSTSSEFERLRRTGIENPTGKRPGSTLVTTPPAKKLNLQDVKEYTEAARQRKQLNEGDDGDAGDYEMDDTYSQSSNEEANTPRQSVSLLAAKKTEANTELTTATVTLQEVPGQKMDHAKIISEVMKKYPHLLRDNKNIKLKITQKTPGKNGTAYTVRAEVGAATTPAATTTTTTTTAPAPAPTPQTVAKTGTALAKVLLANKPKGASATASPAAATPSPAAATRSLVAPKPTPPQQSNRIDSRTMHKLIAMGAENMDGPWLCLECGSDGRPIGIPNYKAFRKHLINTHKQKIDIRLCEHCGYRSKNRMDQYYHILTKHQISPPQGVTFPSCKHCKHVAIDNAAMNEHMKTHPRATTTTTAAAVVTTANTRSKSAVAPLVQTRKSLENEKKAKESEKTPEPKKEGAEFECDMCEKQFSTKKALSMHRVAKHTRRRRRREEDEEEEDAYVTEEEEDDNDIDGVLDEDEEYVPKTVAEARKAKAAASNVVALRGKAKSSEAEALSTVATGIATSLGLGQEEEDVTNASGDFQGEIVDEAQYIEEALASVHGENSKDQVIGGETKFLDENGAELQLTAAERAELMSQLDTSEGDADKSADDSITVGESGEVLKDGDEVLMVYGGPKGAKKKETVPKEEQPSMEEEEENDDMEVEEPVVPVDQEEEEAKQEKDKLIKELEGDWTEDDAEENGEETKAKEEPKEAAVDEEAEDVSIDQIKAELESPTKEAKVAAEEEDTDGKATVGKKAATADSTMPEFMNDWEDE